MPSTTDEDGRRRRRAWILAHHPDRGGDPQKFMAGLAEFDEHRPGPNGTPPRHSGHRPTVYRSRSPLRRALRMVRTLHRRLTHQPRSRRLR